MILILGSLHDNYHDFFRTFKTKSFQSQRAQSFQPGLKS